MHWLLVWAGSLIAVLYSPIGSPDLYSSKSYFSDYPNFIPDKGAIQNLPKINHFDFFNSDEPDMPDMNPAMKSTYSIGNYPTTQISNQESSYTTLQSQSHRDDNSTSVGQNGSGATVLAGRSSQSNVGTPGSVMTKGIPTQSTTSNESNTTPKQSITADNPQGGTDPGGEPEGNPIPVGDGWTLFILFWIIYSLYKTKSIQYRLQKWKNK